MTVTVTLWYVIGCSDCIEEVRRVVNGAVVDFQVTKLTLSPGHRHNHDVPEPPRSISGAVSPAALRAAGQQELPGTQSIAPISTNGFDSEGLR